MSGAPLRWLLGATHVPAGGSLGGIVRYTVELAAALGRRDDVDLHLAVTPPAAGPLRELVADDAHLHRAPGVPGALLPLVERYARTPSVDGGWDVVQGVKHLLPRGLRGAATTTALTVHDMILLDRPDDFGAAKRTLLARPYLASLREADVPLCVSRATLDRLRAHVPAAADRAAVTPLASSPRLLGAAPEPVAPLVGRRFALVVGDPGPRKNVAVVLAAWTRVLAEHPDAVLALVGPPSWGEERYGEHLAALEARGSLVRLEAVPDAALAWCYRHAAVVACPSLVEGFGLPVVEALDLGAPVLTSDDPAQVEVAAGRARAVLPAGDVGGWARELVAVLADRAGAGSCPGGSGHPEPAGARSWDDVAADTVAAVRAARAARAR